jgi:hypothetical protein
MVRAAVVALALAPAVVAALAVVFGDVVAPVEGAALVAVLGVGEVAVPLGIGCAGVAGAVALGPAGWVAGSVGMELSDGAAVD